ncbi:hypothetical protein [Catenuloplanes atrovinosus]|uniref:Uncharacterized protein n=1 Tax=Catenuloplanes atrovinosus TaxID=137266 RepID=A0AAE3YSZ0_9ACTN|nr:hypothetical protein [Catenuloplanes atrovinosus]MDR7277809.1 hypothetical protein [Catenuloplanes atrovinosus]
MMDEQFHSDAIDNAFAAFRTGPDLPAPLGAAAARATVRRRRQVRAGVTTGLTALLIAAPVAAYAAGVIGTNDPPDETATQPPTPSASATSPAPSPSASVETTAPVPDGRIDDATLKESMLDLPAWPYSGAQFCSPGSQRLAPEARDMGDVTLVRTAYVDVDSDGVEETAAVLHCQVAQAGEYQVVVFDRDGAGKIITLGTVVATHLAGHEEGGIPALVRNIGADGNRVRVEVGDVVFCCGGDPSHTQYQWRSYALEGGTFRQVAGETAFPPNPHLSPGATGGDSGPAAPDQPATADLRIASAGMSGTTTGETFTGTITITITVGGTASVNPVVGFALPKGAELKYVPMGCERDDDADIGNRSGDTGAAYLCMMGPTGAGDTTLGGPFEITGPAATFPAGAEKVAYVEVRAAPDPNVWPAAGAAVPETNKADNLATVRFTVG